MLLVARVLVHFVTFNVSRMCGLIVSRFHKFLGSATRLSHLKNFLFGVIVASAPQIKHFNVLLLFLCMIRNRPFIVATVP